MNSISSPAVENTIPVLAVSNLQGSLHFYERCLQFKKDWGAEGATTQIASVSRDGHSIMLQLRQPLTEGCVWIGMADIRPLWRHIRSLADCKPCDESTDERVLLQEGCRLQATSEQLPNEPQGKEVSPHFAARIVQRPTNRHWALEMKIQDPDGNVIWFGSEPLAEVDIGHELTDAELDPA